jgi:hypothetical protein
VIALEEDRVAAAGALDQKVHRALRVRPPVDIIAHVDLDRAIRAAVRDIGVDHPEHLLEQVSASMDVADRIDPNTVRQPRLGG